MTSLEVGDSTPQALRLGRQPGTGTHTRASVAIGFGSPSGDSGVTQLDLNDILVRHPQASFLMRGTGSGLQALGVDDGDLLLVDRALHPVHGHVVIAVVGEEFVCRRLCTQGGGLRLQATQAGAADIVAGEGVALQLWGVVTHVIKALAT